LLIRGVPLHRDLDRALLALALERDDLALNRLLVLVQVGDEVNDPALVAELRLVAFGTLVDDRDPQATGQEGGLAHPLLDRLEVELERLEDVSVGKEGDRRTGLLGPLPLLQVAQGPPALIRLRPGVAIALDLHGQALRQSVDHRDPDAVQAAGDLVAAAVAELP